MKKALKIIGIIFASIIAMVLIFIVVIAINSPGKLESLKDESGKEIANSLAEKSFVEIGGVQQGFFIRSENVDNQVILFLHGGPGSPELPIILPYETPERLEKYFTVCYWDQRGAGMSFNNLIDTASMTLEQLIEDTREMTEYLKTRFNKEKIYLVGHSWGSYLGVKTIEKYPEHYWAYIGIGQVCNQLISEQLAYDYMLRHAMEIGDKSAIKSLQKFDKNAADFPNLDYLMNARMPLMNKYGIGMRHEKASMSAVVKQLLLFEGYTFSEKLKYVGGMGFSQKYLWDGVVSDNLFESSTSFQVPIYIVHGKYDYQVSHTLAKEWFEQITAPEKAFFTFEQSAHSPNIEEVSGFVGVVREVAKLR